MTGFYENYDDAEGVHKGSAEQSALEAAASATAAASSATSSETSATSSSTKAGEAATSASTATTKAAEAATSATTATTKASESATSAAASDTSATESATSATASESSRQASASAAAVAVSAYGSAFNSATASAASATAAAGSESAVAASATAAAGSATTASTSASNAATSETNAATSATAAAASATLANSAEVVTVAGIASDVTAVAGIDGNVTSVAGIASDVTTVAAEPLKTNIATVAATPLSTNINIVGPAASSVTTVAGDIAKVNTVAADLSGSDTIGTVAGVASNVTTVSGIAADVTTVAGITAGDISLVAAIDDKVTQVAAINDQVAVVGSDPYKTKVETVAESVYKGKVETVSGLTSEVTSVANIASDVTTVSANITDIQNAEQNANTATTKAAESAASAVTSAASASTSASSAAASASSATAAASSESNAATSESDAAVSASSATVSAASAQSSKEAAAVSETNAAASYDSFDDRYLGVKSSAPATDNDGGALLTGALYFNSTNNTMNVFTGSAWAPVANNNIINPNVALTQDLATNGNDIKFGDNDKATFGASDDLQIFHDGIHSRIIDAGTGNLSLQGNDLRIKNSDATATYIQAANGGAVELAYNNNIKLATTSTGIDVTGNVVADGLSVDGTATFDTVSTLFANLNYFGSTKGKLSTDGINFNIEATANLYTKVNSATRMLVGGNGDISFYEDTGTTPKLFWDASAESLGIGDSSAISTISGAPLRIGYAGANNTNFDGIHFLSGSNVGGTAFIDYRRDANSTSSSLLLGTSNTERMRIDASGNVGVGTSSPFGRLSVDVAAGAPASSGNMTNGFTVHNSNGGRAIQLGVNESGAYNYLQSSYVNNANVAVDMAFFTGANERMRIDASGLVTVKGSGAGSVSDHFRIESSDTESKLAFVNTTGNGAITQSGGDMRFMTSTANTERMRIGSTGQVLIGRTTTSGVSNGHRFDASGFTQHVRDGSSVLELSRGTSDGDIQVFKKGGTTVGSIGTFGGTTYFASNSHGFLINGTQIEPCNNNGGRLDNTVDVGSSTYRFKDLNLSGTVNTEAVSTNSLDLQAIAESKSVTATDVFVYDTSKDSDGGAWRHRTQGTSWYNEALNTGVRGATKKFPAVAVIVALPNGGFIIYDGDDPSMPMWKTCTQHAFWYEGVVTSITARDGSVFVGCTLDVYKHDFISDTSREWLNSEYRLKVDSLGANSQSGNYILLGNYGIVNRYVNDVAVTVLPNAPIDADTGLPVPTIAVATISGVSVIKDDGTVVDITHTASTYKGAKDITFKGEQISYSSQQSGGSANYWRKVYIDIPSSDVSGAYLQSIAGVTAFDARGTVGQQPPINTNDSLGDGSNNIKDAIHDAVGFTNKLTLLDVGTYSATATNFDSALAYITSDYNTGWMNGDIKLATLSDTDDTNVTGSELITNGTFASTNLSDWSEIEIGSGTATFNVTSGALRVNLGGSYDSGVGQQFTTVAGQTYALSFDVSFVTNFNLSNYIQFSVGTSLNNVNLGYSTLTSDGTYTLTFTATGTTAWVSIRSASSANTTGEYSLDNISVRLAEPDRSVNGNGLQVFGTVTKTAVATGADLVAYSGFSSSNYLQQPYNSDLDFGTGDFCITMWLKFNTDNAYDGIFDRAYYTGSAYSGSGFRIETGGNNSLVFKRQDGLTIFSVGSNPTGTWLSYTLTRKSGVIYVYVNGVLQGSVANTTDFTNVNAKLRVGGKFNGTPQDNTSTALFRISATAPTAEQIAKMYRDEKPLFQEGAQATLYGTSDAVTALAYDDDTELLHAGTSAGRSVFKGLQRVSNTTDAVGAAISASNDLVVEE